MLPPRLVPRNWSRSTTTKPIYDYIANKSSLAGYISFQPRPEHRSPVHIDRVNNTALTQRVAGCCTRQRTSVNTPLQVRDVRK